MSYIAQSLFRCLGINGKQAIKTAVERVRVTTSMKRDLIYDDGCLEHSCQRQGLIFKPGHEL
jgi:hypothetical protein